MVDARDHVTIISFSAFVANHLLRKINMLNTKAEKEIIVTWLKVKIIEL